MENPPKALVSLSALAFRLSCVLFLCVTVGKTGGRVTTATQGDGYGACAKPTQLAIFPTAMDFPTVMDFAASKLKLLTKYSLVHTL